jgi:hypothetical protein
LTAYKRSRISVLFLLSILLVPGFSESMLGQEERGTVKADSLPVYAGMSTDSDVVATLARGKMLRIMLSVTNGDGMWCSVSDIDSSARLGFVRCEQLDRQNVPSTAASGTGALSSVPFDPVFSTQPRSRAQEGWAVAASAILSEAAPKSMHWIIRATPRSRMLQRREVYTAGFCWARCCWD